MTDKRKKIEDECRRKIDRTEKISNVVVVSPARAHSSAEMWKSSQRVAEGHTSSSPDGLHAGKVALDLVRFNTASSSSSSHLHFTGRTPHRYHARVFGFWSVMI